MRKLRLLDLFSGIGGLSLGLERSGAFQTSAFCEIEPYCRKVLKKHWPDVPIYEDVRSLSGAVLAADGIGIDAICGGSPCQDISEAGKKAGLSGERSGLWYEYARIIGEVRPRYVIVENVSDLLIRGLDDILRSLAALGYDAEWHCIQACDVGAYHIRDRVFIIAYPSGVGLHGEEGAEQGAGAQGLSCRSRFFERTIKSEREMWWPTQPYIPRVAYGVPSAMDRRRALGNAVVPQIAKLIGDGIKRYENLKNPIDK